MRAVADFAERGGPVLGICNGFQVLAEAGLVPGALLRNRGLRFVCRQVSLRAEHLDTPFTRELAGAGPLRMPVAHGEGCYFADEATLDALEGDGRVLWRYVERRRRRGRARGRGQPQRVAARDRGRAQRRRQRRGPDAPPGDGGRGDPRQSTTASGSSARWS